MKKRTDHGPTAGSEDLLGTIDTCIIPQAFETGNAFLLAGSRCYRGWIYGTGLCLERITESAPPPVCRADPVYAAPFVLIHHVPASPGDGAGPHRILEF